MAFKPIQILINAKDDASAVFDKLQTKVAAVGAAILGYFGVKSFVGMVRGAADLEQAMSRVQAATGATADEMVELRNAAESASRGTKFSAVDTAAALENLAKAGLSAKDAIATLPAVTNLAQAGDLELGQSAEYVTKAIMGLGLAFEDAARVADVLALGANATNTSVGGLAQALSYAAPVANSLGLSLESTVGILGKFADAGIDASRAGTALNSILSQFSNPATKFRQELAAAGITTTNFEDALHQLAAAGPAGERAINAVGQEAGPALRSLLNLGMGALDDLTARLHNAEGSAAQMAAIMNKNLRGALDGLANAWQTVTNALTTPVLPVLQSAVEKLTGSLQKAVSDGTVARFGQALATGFQSAITWARNFLASFDVDALATKLQGFAGRAQEAFDAIGRYASNAGNVVKTAWGVMAAGANTAMSAMYGIASVMAELASAVQGGVALILEAWSKITFGGLSEGFRRAAEEVRLSAEATGAVADEFGRRAKAAFDDAASAAQLARDGFDGITEALNGGAEAAERTSGAIGDMAAQLQAVAEANGKAAEASRATTAAQEEQTKKAAEAKAAQEALRTEYERAVENKDWQRAAELMQKLGKAAEGAGVAVKSAADKAREAAAEIAAAFEQAGIKTKADLQTQAATARRQFEIIKQSGQATSAGLQEAWKRAAEAAIAANDGVAPAWVQGQASAYKYQLAVDEAGKATLKLAGTDLSGLANGLNSAAGAANNYAAAVAKASQNSLGVIDHQQPIKSTQISGETRFAGTDLGTRTGIAAFLKAAGVDDDAVARRIANEFADKRGNIPFFDNPGQKKYGGDGGTLSMALLKAAEQYTFDGVGRQAGQGATIPKPESVRNVRVNLEVNGQGFGAINTDAAGADALEGLLAELQRSRSVTRH